MKTNSVYSSRLNWIDYGKGIGIIFVVYGHVIKGLITPGLIDERFYYYSVNFVYSFHMPLFFILFGYLFFLQNYLSNFFVKYLEQCKKQN